MPKSDKRLVFQCGLGANGGARQAAASRQVVRPPRLTDDHNASRAGAPLTKKRGVDVQQTRGDAAAGRIEEQGEARRAVIGAAAAAEAGGIRGVNSRRAERGDASGGGRNRQMVETVKSWRRDARRGT